MRVFHLETASKLLLKYKKHCVYEASVRITEKSGAKMAPPWNGFVYCVPAILPIFEYTFHQNDLFLSETRSYTA